MRVLIVEPDAELAGTIAKFLEKNNHQADISRDAQEAVLLADKNKPDIVVLELGMPKNNGIAFINEFRSYTDWIMIPLVIYSQIPQEDAGLTSADWQKLGVARYLYKPTKTLANLLAAVENAA